MTKEQYVCQRAANAIVSEIGPYQISSDALQSINQFLDQVLMLLLQRAHSLDLSIIKSHVLNLLPLTLGKNAIVEAELEVKTYSETSVIDYPLYERMRSLQSTLFTLDQIYDSLRHQCIDHCTLANKTSDSPIYNNSNKDNDQGLVISPMVIIYITTVLEHMAEYILTTIAVTAGHEDTEYIRVKDVYLALLDDVQVGGLFQQTDIRTKLEKRVISYQAQHQSYQRSTLPSPAPSPAVSYKNEASSASQDTFDHQPSKLYSDYRQSIQDDNDIDYDDFYSEPPPSAHTQTSFSIKSTQSSTFYRPVSVISNGTTATNRSSSSSKKGFRFFGKKEKRSSVTSHSTANTNYRQDSYRRTMSPPPSALGYSPSSTQVYDPDAPALDFEDLIRSGNTMKVSLTPNRLRSIEVKSTVYEPHHSNISSPTSPTSNGRSLTAPPNRLAPISTPFENPRAAPKPPVAHHTSNMAAKYQQTPPLTPDSSFASRLSNTRSPPPSFENGQQQQKQPHRTYLNSKQTKQPPPAPLQLVGQTNQQHRKQASVDTEIEDVCAMDLPSPPNTTDHHPSLSTFSDLSNQPTPSTSTSTLIPKSASLSSVSSNKPRYNRPSSMVAKRASGSVRPPSYHESFAMTMEHQQSQNESASSGVTRSSPTGHIGSVPGDQPPTTITIAPSPLRSSTPPIPPTKSTTAATINIDPVMTPTRTMMRRRTTRPLSQMIAVEEEQIVLDKEKGDIHGIEVTRSSNGDSNDESMTKTPPTVISDGKGSLQDKDTTFATASYDRRDRILQLLQQQRKPVMVDSSMQTDPLPGIPSLATLLTSLSTSLSAPALVVLEDSGQQDRLDGTKERGGSMTGSEQGLVDGDEEWFMQDEDWDDTHDQDSVMAEWLLGEN